MTRLEHRIAEWHWREFGSDVNLAETYRKLLEEIGELGAALIRGDESNAFEELGDCGLLLAHITRGIAGSNERKSFAAAMACAQDKCDSRGVRVEDVRRRRKGGES